MFQLVSQHFGEQVQRRVTMELWQNKLDGQPTVCTLVHTVLGCILIKIRRLPARWVQSGRALFLVGQAQSA